MKTTSITTLVFGAMMLAGCGGNGGNDTAPARTNPVAACLTCHSFTKGVKRPTAPNLHDIVGKPAGSEPGFRYSDALKNSGIVWTREKLDAYLANPRALIPGTRMIYAGEPDAARRQAMIDYMQNGEGDQAQ